MTSNFTIIIRIVFENFEIKFNECNIHLKIGILY
jgi:hypothetical protein